MRYYSTLVLVCIIPQTGNFSFQLVIVSQILQTGVSQGYFLGPLLFILNINDLYKSIKHSRAYDFAEVTNILYSNE